jgi:hypothetical protein
MRTAHGTADHRPHICLATGVHMHDVGGYGRRSSVQLAANLRAGEVAEAVAVVHGVTEVDPEPDPGRQGLLFDGRRHDKRRKAGLCCKKKEGRRFD